METTYHLWHDGDAAARIRPFKLLQPRHDFYVSGGNANATPAQLKLLGKMNNMFTKIKMVMAYFPTPDPGASAAVTKAAFDTAFDSLLMRLYFREFSTAKKEWMRCVTLHTRLWAFNKVRSVVLVFVAAVRL